MFLAEKGVHDIARVEIDLNAGQHREPAFLARNPLARVPVLELDDGRFLAESRAICTYLEALYPEPNLMGRDGEERAFIEMADRQVEFSIFVIGANYIRHTHPGLGHSSNHSFRISENRRARSCCTVCAGSTACLLRSLSSPANASRLPTSRRSVPSSSCAWSSSSRQMPAWPTLLAGVTVSPSAQVSQTGRRALELD